MAGTVILHCPDANGSDLTDVGSSTQHRWRCEPEGNTLEQKPTVLSVAQYCALDETDCGEVESEPGQGMMIQSAEDFAVISGWVMVIFSVAFGAKTLRKTISSRL